MGMDEKEKQEREKGEGKFRVLGLWRRCGVAITRCGLPQRGQLPLSAGRPQLDQLDQIQEPSRHRPPKLANPLILTEGWAHSRTDSYPNRFFHCVTFHAGNMNHMRGLVSTAQALRQTFIAPLRTPKAFFVQPRPLCNASQQRCFHMSPRLALPVVRTPNAPTQIKDEAIGTRLVQLVDEEQNLMPPRRLAEVLDSFDRSKFFLLQVSPAESERPPVCKILNKMEAKQHEKAKAKSAKVAKVQTKQIELNWAIDAHDLSHRLKQLTNFLEKGRKVEVIMKRKKAKRAPTVDEIKQVIQSVLDTTREVGATQVKAMEGEPGKQVIITVKKET
ncbi:uncharacterized protein N7458_006574 [Penicillium daleae]|uniref:Translation initiation factor 3 N-terminal domain-containing protein n=1 Tax=Penicillium daleae TaxID=63821 RepID=A0AAD6C6W3_9EURO|nr:uncharacterized protein N7458_006574 [Penicillium daleae]KAJ5450125.1 hypothetical protein N7458_006574 [Penicillium daleae]